MYVYARFRLPAFLGEWVNALLEFLANHVSWPGIKAGLELSLQNFQRQAGIQLHTSI